MTRTKRATLLLVFSVASVTSLYSRAKELRTAALPAEPAASGSTQTATLSYEFFRTKVGPIFLKNRPEHARCYGCHILSNRIFHLETLSPGNTDWTDEQSKRNFERALEVVVPDDPDWLMMAEWVRGVGTDAVSESAPHSLTRIYVTNSASDTTDVIDPATNKVVQVIHGIELPHGIVFSPDGVRIYISNEAESVLDVVDRKSGEILSKVPLSARPNNLAITKDGSQVLVGIRAKSGVLDVIDTTSLKNVKSIP